MKVVTWNVGKFARRHDEAWSYLRERLRPDIALLQEARIPNLSNGETVAFRPVYKEWGTALYARGALLREVIMPRYSERVAVAIVEREEVRIGVASIHAPIVRDRVFPHLEHIFDDVEAALNDCPAIIGGDLNSARLCEAVWPGFGHGPFFDRIARGRFIDCHWQTNGKEIQTFFRRGYQHRFQCDHIFASSELARKIKSCKVVNDSVTRQVSDHVPIMVEFDMPRAG